MAKYPKIIEISESEKKLEKDGRTVYLKLIKPINIDGQTLTHLRFKGVRPRVTADGSVEPYVKGGGFVDRILKIDRSGNLYVAKNDGNHPELRTNPTGTMFADHAHTEFEIMKSSQGKKYSTDYAFCEGTYADMHLNNEPVGFVVCGMTAEDVRITIQSKTIDNGKSQIRKPFLKNIVTGDTNELTENEVTTLYKNIGKTFRAYHNSGKYHLYPHTLNIGVIKKNDTIEVLLRDLNTSTKKSSFQGAPLSKAKQEATARFLDLSRLIYDLSVEQESFDVMDGDEEKVWIDARRFIKPLLQGYFQELAETDQNTFSKLVDFCNHSQFNTRIASLVGRDSKILDGESMDSSNKYFGQLWQQLLTLAKGKQ